MIKEIFLLDEVISYKIRRHGRARWLRLSIEPNGLVVATMPKWVPEKEVIDFMLSKKSWVVEAVKNNKLSQQNNIFTPEHYLTHKGKAEKLIKFKVEEFNKFYNFNYNQVFVRNQKTCWGSCTSKKNLNFSYKLMFLPTYLLDYIVVHELCHLKEMNHSARFWSLVERQIRDYKIKRQDLRLYEKKLM